MSEDDTRAVRLQMELARLLNVPFTSDREGQARAAVDETGWLEPGLPGRTDLRAEPPLITLNLRIPLDRLEHLVHTLRNANINI